MTIRAFSGTELEPRSTDQEGRDVASRAPPADDSPALLNGYQRAELQLVGHQRYVQRRAEDRRRHVRSGQAMKPPHVVISVRAARRLLAWSTFLAITLLLALLLQALAASALVAPDRARPPPDCQTGSPATAALADGDDVRARFLANLCSGATGATSKP